MLLRYERQSRLFRILIVEDDQLQQDVLKTVLASHGYEVEAASDGLDALWKVREGKYDLVIVDYQLPEINGFTMARLIRDLMTTVARPGLIALTAFPDVLVDKEEMTERAFDDVIPKCADLAGLISAVQRHLAARPDITTLKEAASTLLLSDWTDYDVGRDTDNGPGGQSLPPCILVVEDDELQQSVLKSALESCGYRVETAVDGLQAVRMIRQGTFDLAVVDYHMPEMDGLATGRLIVDLLNEDSRPRMIAFTSAPAHLFERLTDTGSAFDEIVAKSAGLPVMLATVKRHLQSSPRSATRRAVAIIHQSAA